MEQPGQSPQSDTSQKFPPNARGSGCSSPENYRKKDGQRASRKGLWGPPKGREAWEGGPPGPALGGTEGLTGSEGTETQEGK